MEITRISGAAWFKIRSGKTVLHFDPGYSGYFQNQKIPLNELDEKADLILVTHFHKDHLQPEALDRIAAEKTVIIASQGCISRINHQVRPAKPGDEFNIDGITIKTVEAYNTPESHATRKVHHQGDGVGYLVGIDNNWIYFAGDTDYIPEMKNLGQVDIAFLPIGGTFLMDIEEAAAAAEAIHSRIVIPMHQAKNDPAVFQQKVLAKSSSEVIILNVGEKVSIV